MVLASRNIVTTDSHLVWSDLAVVFSDHNLYFWLIMTDRDLFWSNVESKIAGSYRVGGFLQWSCTLTFHHSTTHMYSYEFLFCPYVTPMLAVCYSFVFVCTHVYPCVTRMLPVCCLYWYDVHGVQPGHLSVSREASLPRRLTFLGVCHAFLLRVPPSCGAGTRNKSLNTSAWDAKTRQKDGAFED